MKILWLCNIMLPKIALKLAKPAKNIGGWLVGLSNDLLKRSDIQLTVCFPSDDINDVIEGKADNLNYYGFPFTDSDYVKYNSKFELNFIEILEREKPDVVHIFGTEFPFTLAMVKSCEKVALLDRVVISIQGLVSVCAKHYFANLPDSVINGFTIKEFIKQSNIKKQRNDFEKRGEHEIDALKEVKHVIGRTSWDKTCTSQINQQITYHHCNETLRDEFYKHEWTFDKCEKYSIFLSQSGYPLKGFHYILEALPHIINKYPTAHVYTTGSQFLSPKTIREKLSLSSYQRYIAQLIDKYHLQHHITILGTLNEQQMCERFLKSHVFISSSTMENESNSLSEAKLLGTPIVASYVGGVIDRITHGADGFFYQHDAPGILAGYVCEIFGNKRLAIQFSKNGRERAKEILDRSKNLNTLLSIYNSISTPVNHVD